MINRITQAKFVKFLLENDALGKYFIEFGKARHIGFDGKKAVETWLEYCNIREMSDMKLIQAAFDWQRAENDADFWYKIDRKWRIFILADMTNGLQTN